MITVNNLYKEVSPLSSKDCFIVIERLKNSFNFPVHVHPEYELNFIEHASGAERIVGDSRETIGERDLVLLTSPQLEHAWMNHTCTSHNIHEITIQFHASSLPDSLLEKNQFIGIQRLFRQAEKGLAFGSKTIDKVRPILKSITCETDGFYSLMKFLTLLHELSRADDCRILANRLSASDEELTEDGLRLEQVLNYLSMHYQGQVRLSEIAELLSMSDSSFCRFIKRSTGQSFVDFLTDIRIGYAIRQLIDTHLSIAEIGFRCGFSNLSNFNRIFKQKKEVTPSEFRESYRKQKIII